MAKTDSRTIASMIMSGKNSKSYLNISYHIEKLNLLTPTLYITSVYALLYEFLGSSYIDSPHFTKLTNLLCKTSKGCYRKDAVLLFQEAIRTSIASLMSTKPLELKHTLKLIQELTLKIESANQMEPG